MKPSRLPAVSSLSLATALFLSHSPSSFAQSPDWVPRCRLPLADSSKPENGNYFFQTRGKAAGAVARANFDYNSEVSARTAIYPTSAKDLLNPYSNVSVSIGYVAPGDGKTAPTVGHISFRAIGKEFKAIPGGTISIRVKVDQTVFGPFESPPQTSGMYSVWLDTAETDGDSKPPVLAPADFSRLAKAIDAAKTVDVALVRDGEAIVTAVIEVPQRNAWRDGLAAWAAKTMPGVSGAATNCSGGGEVLQ